MRRGVATFTLDEGKCPRWLFDRMVRLGREMIHILVAELGPDEFVRRISDPVWFQSLGTVLAFDWNASGLTTILTAALKEAIRGEEKNLGIFICGGKGKTSRKTPDEIQQWGNRLGLPGGVVSNLTYNSRMAAKVDSALVQDGFQIYHHAFFLALSKSKGSSKVSWAVVQQGMNKNAGTARRYHWFSEHIKDLVCEPHSGIVSDIQVPSLNMTAQKSDLTRTMSVELTGGGYKGLMKDIEILRRHVSSISQSLTIRKRLTFAEAPAVAKALADRSAGKQGELFTFLNLENREFRHHPVEGENFSRSKYLEKILAKLVDQKPKNYEHLLATEGVGPKTIRALALVSEIIYGAKPSYEDPARYSFAFGGKDATPYPIERETYDEAIGIMQRAVSRSRIGTLEKDKILRRLAKQST